MTRDVDGNVLSVTTSEPRFTRADKALLLAARRKALEPRGSHGFTMAEAIDPKNFGKFKVGQPITDLALKVQSEAREAWKAKYGGDGMDYLIFRVEKDD